MTERYAQLRAALERVEKFHHPDVIASWFHQAAAVRALLADYDRLNVQLRIERAKNERIFGVLMGIHALLFPAVVKSGGTSYRFTPKDAVEWAQRISDRIRSIPDDLAALAQEQGESDD